MQTEANRSTRHVRPEDMLPDDRDTATFDGITVRKGTIAAFIENARAWLDPATGDDDRADLASELVAMAPSLRALGVFDIFDARDQGLRDLINGGA